MKPALAAALTSIRKSYGVGTIRNPAPVQAHLMGGKWASLPLYYHALKAEQGKAYRSELVSSARPSGPYFSIPAVHCGVPTNPGDTGCKICNRSFVE